MIPFRRLFVVTTFVLASLAACDDDTTVNAVPRDAGTDGAVDAGDASADASYADAADG